MLAHKLEERTEHEQNGNRTNQNFVVASLPSHLPNCCWLALTHCCGESSCSNRRVLENQDRGGGANNSAPLGYRSVRAPKSDRTSARTNFRKMCPRPSKPQRAANLGRNGTCFMSQGRLPIDAHLFDLPWPVTSRPTPGSEAHIPQQASTDATPRARHGQGGEQPVVPARADSPGDRRHYCDPQCTYVSNAV